VGGSAWRKRIPDARRALPSCPARTRGSHAPNTRRDERAMSIGDRFEFPAEQAKARARMKRLCKLSCATLVSGAIALYLTTGNSQSMKTAWMTDLLTILPPLSMLIALRYEQREPTPRFPYGYLRSISVAYLVTAARCRSWACSSSSTPGSSCCDASIPRSAA
jgi:hypothetical protein